MRYRPSRDCIDSYLSGPPEGQYFCTRVYYDPTHMILAFDSYGKPTYHIGRARKGHHTHHPPNGLFFPEGIGYLVTPKTDDKHGKAGGSDPGHKK